MWHQIARATLNRIDRDFALRRILEIDQEISAVRNLRNLQRSPKREDISFVGCLQGEETGTGIAIYRG